MGRREENPIAQLDEADISRFRRSDRCQSVTSDLIISCDPEKVIKLIGLKFDERDQFGYLSNFDNLSLGSDLLSLSYLPKIESIVRGHISLTKSNRLKKDFDIVTKFWLQKNCSINPYTAALFQENLRSFGVKTTFIPNSDNTGSFVIPFIEGDYKISISTTNWPKDRHHKQIDTPRIKTEHDKYPHLITLKYFPREDSFGFPFKNKEMVTKFIEVNKDLVQITATSLNRAIIRTPVFNTHSMNLNISWPINWERYDIEVGEITQPFDRHGILL